jgi:hypothetical protein
MPRGIYDRKAAKAKAKREGETPADGAQDIPLDAIPDRPTKRGKRGKRRQRAVPVPARAAAQPPGVFAEYDTRSDTMYLAMGRLRLPLRVK